MKREIKFRAIHKFTKDKVDEDSLVFQAGHWFEDWRDFEDGIPLNRDLWAIVQYTNINDKKGRPIFEDDILKGPSTYPMQVLMDKGHVEVVYKDAGEPVIELFFQGEVFQNDLEVIGNIHQHKHLLEVFQ